MFLNRIRAVVEGGSMSADRHMDMHLLVLVCVVAFGTIETCCPAPAWSEAIAQVINGGFESGQLDEAPEGWSPRNAQAQRFQVAVVEENPHSGHRCVRIQRDSIGTGEWRDLGKITQRIAPDSLRGYRFRLSGWLRLVPSKLIMPQLCSARLWIRVLRTGGRTGFADELEDRPVRSGLWQYAEIVGEVPQDADSIRFGLALEAGGTLWADDLKLERLGHIGEGDQAPRPISARGQENLIAFARLLGYVRYFHPSDEAASEDWDSFAIRGVDEVEGARSPEELASRLRALFGPIAASVRMATHPLAPLSADTPKRGGKTQELVGWWHLGLGQSSGVNVYRGWRVWAHSDAPTDSILPPGSSTDRDLGGGVFCSVPLTLFTDKRGTIPRGRPHREAMRRPAGWIPSGDDRATRLADVILSWNATQHFYPYWDVVGTSWPRELPLALQRAAVDRDRHEFNKTLRRMVAQMHDGHGAVLYQYRDPRNLPVSWEIRDGRLILNAVDSTIAGVHPGDEVLALNDRPIAEWIAEAMELEGSATPRHQLVKMAWALHTLPTSDTVAVDLRSPSGHLSRARLARKWEPFMSPSRPARVAELRPGVLYVDLGQVRQVDFARMLPQLQTAKGIVFDARAVPQTIIPIISHLIDSAVIWPRFRIPIVLRPDLEGVRFDEDTLKVEPVAPRLRARVAFLVDGSAISNSETALSIIEQYHLAELVGEPTGGTNGNVIKQTLPGGYCVWFTGLQALTYDGSRHHGVGILPTAPVPRTADDVIAGRDAQLESALDIVSK
jgi:hypothetical protein